MEMRKIGTLDVSVVGLGCNNFGMRIDANATAAVVDAALEAGINYFDTAESYGNGTSEEYLGAALADRRDDAVIATKWGGARRLDETHPPGSPDAARTALDASLRRLGVDHVDHYQLHRPDPETPIVDTLSVLAELRDAGKVREIGCSNFSAAQIDDAADVALELDVAPFASVQNHYSLLTRDPERDGVLAACERTGTAFVPFFPLESGVLTGKYRPGRAYPPDTRLAVWGERAQRFVGDGRLETVQALDEFAVGAGHTVLDLAIGWLVTNPLVTSVICGATKPDQVTANVAAASWRLTDAELARVDTIVG
jgi:aryl-alcohol dehydrogenase-like predicted oxidoreductase